MAKEQEKEVSWAEAAAAIKAGKPIPNGVLHSPYGRSDIDIGEHAEAGVVRGVGVDGDDTNTGSSASAPARHGAKDD